MQNHHHQESPMETPTEKVGPAASYNCFRCNKSGHFVKDCPEITPKRTPISHPSSSPTSDPVFPTTHCRCGAGPCHIRVSASSENPNRKYYKCPTNFGKSCDYFKWCDELREDEVRKCEPKENFPECGCGAGICTVRVQDTDPHKGRKFFACPIRKGDGACSFKQWLDDSPHSALPLILTEDPLVGERDKRSDVISARSDAIYQPVQNETLRKNVGIESTTEIQLNYSVTKSVANPHSAASPGTFPNLNLVTMPEDNASATSVILENSSKEVFDASPGLDNQSWSKGTSMSGTILEAFEKSGRDLGNKLITVLESIDPKDHKTMSKEANNTFDALDHLQIEYGLFHLRVTEYIKQAVSLSQIEQTINEDAPSEDLLNRYKIEKSHYDKAFRAYREANDTYVASSKRLKTLRKEASYLRDLLAELGKKLGYYEIENAKDEDSLERISKTMSESKVSFREATEALGRYEKREIERSAAKAALETARTLLRK